MTTTYPELLDRLHAAAAAGIVLGLDRVRTVLAALGHPERRLGAVVHVAGTNGKGSTAALVAAIARAAGARVALYTSPHLTSLRERVVVDGAPVSEAALCAAADEAWAAGAGALTFFEQVTVLALVAMARAAVDVTVLEVGLGGRLDATNVVDAPVAVVTGVALDHQALLGLDLRAIAGEKAGIFKPGQRVVIGAAGEPEAVGWLAASAWSAGAAAVTVLDEAAVAAAPPSALAGEHQRANVACALAALDALVAAGGLPALAAAHALGGPAAVAVAIEQGLASVVHPGRLETVARAPTVVLDGAHNPHGAAALARHLRTRRERPRVLVLAVSADKDVAALVAEVATAVDALVCTRYDQPRALPAERLAALARVHHDVVLVADDLAAAVTRAVTLAGADGLVVVAGSLYAVAEVRPRFVAMAVDPVRTADPAARAR